MPNMWFIHNPDSIKVLTERIEKLGVLDKMDFSNTFIFVPSNFSKSKRIHFSSDTFIKFRKLIKDKAIYVLYEENYKGCLPDSKNLKDYMNSYPIIPLLGSAVENVFIPFLYYIGIKNIYFSGVDHMDTGHFWDRNEYYGKAINKKIRFDQVQSEEFINKCVEIAKKKCLKKSINVYRLEKTETILKLYDYITFEEALKISSNKRNI